MDEKTERNLEIFKKKMKGVTYRKLSQEYNLAITTILTIVKRYKKLYPNEVINLNK